MLLENDHDKMFLASLGAFQNIINVPTPISEEEISQAKASLQDINLTKHYKGLVAFDGDFSQECDVDNLEFLLTSVWPKLLDADEDLRLDVFGNDINKRVLELCKAAPRVRPIVNQSD